MQLRGARTMYPDPTYLSPMPMPGPMPGYEMPAYYLSAYSYLPYPFMQPYPYAQAEFQPPYEEPAPPEEGENADEEPQIPPPPDFSDFRL